MERYATWGVLACSGMLAVAALAFGDEEKVPLDKVPFAVMKAVKDKFPKAEILQAEKEEEDGKTIYEIGLKSEGHAIDVSLQEDGKILEVEKEIAADDLPKPVADAVKAKYPKGTIKKAEEVMEDDETKYEVLLANGDETREVVLDAKGKILKDEDDDEDEDDKG